MTSPNGDARADISRAQSDTNRAQSDTNRAQYDSDRALQDNTRATDDNTRSRRRETAEDTQITRLADSVAELATETRGLTEETIAAEALRSTKIKWIQRQLLVIIPSVILLVLLAFTNFAILNSLKYTARSTQQTNQLLVGCLTPGTQCSELNRKQAAELNNQIRQQAYVIATCQRQNPVDADHPDGSTAKLLTCIHRYYPDLQLPPEVK